MDPRLLEAAQTGDVDLLNDLIRSNRLILEEAALLGASHTPLHVACVAGHSNFVRELLKLMPKYAEKVNPDGFSPLHIAAARGDVEIVREILKAGWPQHLCHLKGRERRIPLHYAAANGEVGALKELLSASPESVEEMTAREETVLHLSVKNNRFNAFVVLLEHLKQHNKEQVINWKDKKGDTVLHLAAAAKNFEVLDIMLSGHALQRDVVEVNALNESGSTPLDVSSRSDQEIREIFMQARAKHGQSNLPSSQIVLVHSDEDNIEGATSDPLVGKPSVENDHPPLPSPKDSKQERESLSCTRSDLLVVAGLIASATYQAVLQPPMFYRKAYTHAKKGSLTAFLAPNNIFTTNISLFLFLSTNTFGFLVSALMIGVLTASPTFNFLMKLSMVYMIATYFILMSYVPSRSLQNEDYSFLGETLINSLAFLIPGALLGFAIRKHRQQSTKK